MQLNCPQCWRTVFGKEELDMRLLLQWQKLILGYLNTKRELNHIVNRFVRCVIRQCSIIFQKTLPAPWDSSVVFPGIVFQDNNSNSKIRIFLYAIIFQHFNIYWNPVTAVCTAGKVGPCVHDCHGYLSVLWQFWQSLQIHMAVHSTFNWSMYSIKCKSTHCSLVQGPQLSLKKLGCWSPQKATLHWLSVCQTIDLKILLLIFSSTGWFRAKMSHPLLL